MIKLSDIRKTLPFEIRKGSSSDTMNQLIRYQKEGYLTIDYDVYLPSKGKNLQRPFVWTEEQKSELIHSIFKGIRLTNISIIIFTDDSKRERKKTYKIIDGKQRLSTILTFINNEFPLHYNGSKYYFKDLPEEMQSILNRFDIVQDLVYEYQDKMISDDNKIAWFEMINFAGTPQDIEHLNNLKS